MPTTIEYLPLIQDLPWHRFTMELLGWVQLLHILAIAFSLYYFYRIFRPDNRWGKRLAKVTGSEPNYPFIFGLFGWLLFLFSVFSRIGRDMAQLQQWNLSPVMTEDLMMQAVAKNAIGFVTYFILGLGLLASSYTRMEIRERGLKAGWIFIPWRQIVQLRWVDQDRLRIYYRGSDRRKKRNDGPNSVLWEIDPDETAELRKMLEERVGMSENRG